MTAYYNENDPKAAAWLRELIKKGLIAHGVLDTRSIEDVKPDEIREFTQCHFFAGIGVWSYALRRAGWSDDRPVWTGSCPCQPFSVAGKKGGVDDSRHLWPTWERLIAECRPAVVFGEQVASKDGLNWLDLVQTNLEISGYAVGAADLCSAGVGAPHIRQRLWFVAEGLGNAVDAGLEGHAGHVDGSDEPGRIEADTDRPATEGSGADRLADTEHDQQRGRGGSGSEGAPGHESGAEPGGRSAPSRLADAAGKGRDKRTRYGDSEPTEQRRDQRADSGLPIGLADSGSVGPEGRGSSESGEPERQAPSGPQAGDLGYHDGPGPTNGLWRDVDWLGCRDGKWRPVRPGTLPLAHGASARVGRLRGYGNAINAEVARVFIESFMEA